MVFLIVPPCRYPQRNPFLKKSNVYTRELFSSEKESKVLSKLKSSRYLPMVFFLLALLHHCSTRKCCLWKQKEQIWNYKGCNIGREISDLSNSDCRSLILALAELKNSFLCRMRTGVCPPSLPMKPLLKMDHCASVWTGRIILTTQCTYGLVSMILKIHVVLGIYWQKWNQKIFTVMFSLSVLVTKNCCVLC